MCFENVCYIPNVNYICHRPELSTYDSSRLRALVKSQLGLFTIDEVEKSLPTEDIDASRANLLSHAVQACLQKEDAYTDWLYTGA